MFGLLAFENANLITFRQIRPNSSLIFKQFNIFYPLKYVLNNMLVTKVCKLGWAPWNLSCFEFKFEDIRLSS